MISLGLLLKAACHRCRSLLVKGEGGRSRDEVATEKSTDERTVRMLRMRSGNSLGKK